MTNNVIARIELLFSSVYILQFQGQSYDLFEFSAYVSETISIYLIFLSYRL